MLLQWQGVLPLFSPSFLCDFSKTDLSKFSWLIILSTIIEALIISVISIATSIESRVDFKRSILSKSIISYILRKLYKASRSELGLKILMILNK